MSIYYLRFEQKAAKSFSVESNSIDNLRSQAVHHLGLHLRDHPGENADGHWRLVVENEVGQQCLHIIVATVVDRNGPMMEFTP